MSGVLLAAVLRARNPEANKEKDLPKVSWRKMCEYLNESDRWRGRKLRILANTFAGGEILYRTPHEVIATPYHRNTQGILDAHKIMTAETDYQALQLIRSRAIDLIILSRTPKVFPANSNQDSEYVFHERLRDRKIPDWCLEVNLPCVLSSCFQLFEMSPAKDLDRNAN
jgi:hypothetical protein